MNMLTRKPCTALLLASLLLGNAWAGSPNNSTPESSASAAASSLATSAAAITPASAAVNAATGAASAGSASVPTANNGKPANNIGVAQPGTGIGNVLQVISALVLVVLVMLGLAWGIKSFGPKRLLGRVPVQVVGGANLGGRERVLVIEVQDQWIVIGTTPNSITTLATLPRQPLNDDELQPGKPFSDWLKQIMEKRNG